MEIDNRIKKDCGKIIGAKNYAGNNRSDNNRTQSFSEKQGNKATNVALLVGSFAVTLVAIGELCNRIKESK